MLLDRLLDSVGLEVLPAAICDLRRGARVELAPQAEPLLHCIVKGRGRLLAAEALPLAELTLVLVPGGTAHMIEPEDGATRTLKLGGERSSDHVPALTAGSGASALLFISGLVRTIEQPPLGLLDGVNAPLAVDFATAAHASQPFTALLEEQFARQPGNRRVIALLLQQCLVYALRALAEQPGCPVPWLRATKHPGLARALQSMLRAPSAPHTSESLARTSGMSGADLDAAFSAAFGRPPLEWLSRYRAGSSDATSTPTHGDERR